MTTPENVLAMSINAAMIRASQGTMMAHYPEAEKGTDFHETLKLWANHLATNYQHIAEHHPEDKYTDVVDDAEGVTQHIAVGLFVFGRSYEEVALRMKAQEGGLNHLCTVCGGDASRLKTIEES